MNETTMVKDLKALSNAKLYEAYKEAQMLVLKFSNGHYFDPRFVESILEKKAEDAEEKTWRMRI